MNPTTTAILATAALVGGAAATWGYAEALMSVIAARSSPLHKVMFKKKNLTDHQKTRYAASEQIRTQPMEDVSIRSRDGLTLRGHWYPCDNPRRVLIMAHGWRSSWHRDFGAVIPFLHNNGCSLLLIEQRAHGESEGNYISYGIFERFDVADWLTFAADRIPAHAPVYLMGISMGAATSLMASELPECANIAGIIADCGFSSPYDIVKKTIGAKSNRSSAPIEAWVVNRLCHARANFRLTDCTPREAMEHNEHIPVLFIHGDADTFVPCEMSHINYQACRAPKDILIVPGAAHSLSYIADPAAYEEKLLAFFETYDEQ